MSLVKQSQKWVNASLISAEQRASILEFESKKNNRSFWSFAYVGAGLLIGLGIILLIASNWSAIPAAVKLYADFALLGALLYGVYWSVTEEHPHWREVFTIVSFLMIGGTIGLVGQIFQLSGSWNNLALYWALLGLPLILISQTELLSAAWIGLLLSAIDEDVWSQFGSWIFDDLTWRTVLAVVLAYTISYSCQKLHERLGERWILPKTAAKLFLFLTYILVAVVGCIWGLDTDWSIEQLGAHLIVLGFLGWQLYVAMRQQQMRSFRTNAILIEVYIFAIFLARFSDLWSTGLGFVGGGLLILGFLWILRRTTRYIKGMEVFSEK